MAKINSDGRTYVRLQHSREETVAGLQDTGNTSAARPGRAEVPHGTAEAGAATAVSSDAEGTALARDPHRWG